MPGTCARQIGQQVRLPGARHLLQRGHDGFVPDLQGGFRGVEVAVQGGDIGLITQDDQDLDQILVRHRGQLGLQPGRQHPGGGIPGAPDRPPERQARQRAPAIFVFVIRNLPRPTDLVHRRDGSPQGYGQLSLVCRMLPALSHTGEGAPGPQAEDANMLQ